MQLLKRSAVTILGAILLLGGAALMVLPGPGILLVVAGLAVLASEYVWAKRLLKRAQKQAQEAQEAAVASPVRLTGSILFAVGGIVVGTLMVLIEKVNWPLWEGILETLWSPLTGSILIVTGLILLVTTLITVKSNSGEETTHTRKERTANGSPRLPV